MDKDAVKTLKVEAGNGGDVALPSVVRCEINVAHQLTVYSGIPEVDVILQSNTQALPDADLELSRKNYIALSQDDCIQIVTKSVNSILQDTCDHEFRKECFDLLQVKTSDEAAEKFQHLLAAMFPESTLLDGNASLPKKVPLESGGTLPCPIKVEPVEEISQSPDMSQPVSSRDDLLKALLQRPRSIRLHK